MTGHRSVTPARISTITVVGAGYVGLTAAACFGALGHRVRCLEHDPQQLGELLAGRIPIHEPGLDELVAEGVRTGRLRFTSDVADAVADASVAFLCVGTPPRADGHPDLRQIAAAAAKVAAVATQDLVIVVKSTVPPGTCEAVEILAAEAAPAGVRVTVVSNPEFLRESQAVGDFFHPDRVVVGSDHEASGDAVAALYPPQWQMVRCDRRSAELVKYASNTFLALKISFANEIAGLCEQAGADAAAVLAGVGADHRVGSSFLQHGPGFGGSCLGKDLTGLIAAGDALGQPVPLARAALQVNLWARHRVVDRLERMLGPLAERRIAVLGLAFKAGTDDVRDSPAISIVQDLIRRNAVVTVFDPVAAAPALGAPAETDPYLAASEADAVIIATGWPEFAELDFELLGAVMAGRLVFDVTAVVEPAAVVAAGLELEVLGRGLPDSFHPVVVTPLEWCLDTVIV